MVKMTQKNFDRLNFLSDKSVNDTITSMELKEYKKLLDNWNTTFELDELNDSYSIYLSDHITH